MPDLHSTLGSVLIDRYTANAARVRELAAPLSEAEFWRKPYAYGNSFGHLVLHQFGIVFRQGGLPSSPCSAP